MSAVSFSARPGIPDSGEIGMRGATASGGGGTREELAKLLARAGGGFRRDAFAESERIARRVLERSSPRSAAHAPLRALTTAHLAEVRRARGDYAEARKLFERALPAVESAFGASSVEHAAVLNGYGIL